MKKIHIPISGLLLLQMLLGGCASYHVRQGNRLYQDLAYSEAIVHYQKALGKGSYPEAQIRLAESYRQMNDHSRAEEAYSRVVQQSEAEPIHRLRYGQLLMSSGKYEQAKNYLDQYLGSQPQDESARKLRMSCDSISYWKQDSARYTIENSGLNSSGSNFSPVWYRDGVVFVSDRNARAKTYQWTGRPFLDLYYARKDRDGKYGMALPIQGDVNGIYHEGPATFNAGHDTMYFTRNHYLKRKAVKSEQDVVLLQLYSSVRKDTAFGQISPMSFNSDQYSVGHPSLSRDGQTLYFASDMPGGEGGSDLYRSEKINGQWSTPQNLGKGINTPYDESFPLLWQDSILYFSSEGHYGMGGLDVFYSLRQPSGAWDGAINMGYPFNSGYDDFGVAFSADGSEGLLSSNRNTQDTKQDQIYSFRIHDLRFTLEGIAVEKQSQLPLAGVEVELSNRKTGEKERVITGEDGKFFFKLNPRTDYSVVGSKDSYFTNTEPVSTVGKLQSENMYVKLKLEMEQIIVNKPIVLENIYYDLDKYDIRSDAAAGLDRLVGIMQDNPEISIELSSHTDSRADDKYNMTLSQRRAESAVSYIVSRGVSSERITARGYGETMLVNRCSNAVECSEEEHQANRRTEFKVTSMKK